MARTQRAYQTVSDDGLLTVNVYRTDRDADGKQKIFTRLEFPTSDLPARQQAYNCAKGLGFYMQGRYATSDEDEKLTPSDIVDLCNALYAEMVADTFIPGRGTGETRPTPFHEALAEYLKVPVHVIVAEIKDKPAEYTKAKLAAMGRDPRVSVITARIVKERAAESEKRNRTKAKELAKSETDNSLFGSLGGLAAAAE